MAFPRIADGTLVVHRLLDVADDLDLGRADALLAGAGARADLPAGRPGFVDWPDRPLTVGLGPRTLEVAGGPPLPATASARLFAHGVVSMRYEVPLPAGADAAALSALVRRVADDAAVLATARRDADGLLARLAPAMLAPHASGIHETYTVVSARALVPPGRPADVEGPDLARVLLGEPPDVALSAQTVADVTRHRFAYTDADVAVLDWDTAFVLDPDDDRSVADVLEVASAQLLELRWYDAVFERELLTVTEALSRPRAGLAWRFFGRYGRILRRVQHLVVESAEVVERVDAAVRVVGDLWLARVYRAAVERFRIPEGQADVRRRREAAADVASLLRHEASSALGHVLEASIVALIVFELVMAVLR